MRRGATLLVVVVVAGIALAAGLDALRGSPEPGPVAETGAEPAATSTPETPEAPPSEQPFGGVLYYTDESCELKAVEPPGQRPVEAPNWAECLFVLSPDGRRVSGAGSGWDPHADPLRGRLFESEGGLIQVSTNGGPEGAPFRGDAPAWRPDGTLTYFADGAVRAWPDRDVVIPERELLAAAMTHINAPADPSVIQRLEARHMAWLDEERAVVAIHATVRRGADLDLAGVFRRGRQLTGYSTLSPITHLWTSPRGQFWAIAADGLQLFQGSTTTLPLPPLVDPVAVAWSPDETYMAVATRASVFVFAPGEAESVQRLPLDARDLDWRGEAGPPALAEAGDAREWLGGVGATGRLFLTESEGSVCALRALRLPDLAWEEDHHRPAACMFTLTVGNAPLAEAISASSVGLTAICSKGGLNVFRGEGTRARLPNACSPAWMPDGTLTFLRDGGLWQGIESPRPLLLREQVGEIFGRPAALEEVAWLDDERFWAVVRSGESAIVALMTTDGLVFSPSFTTRTIEGLQVSATGMVAGRTDQGVVFFDSGGRRALTFPNGRAVSWAPGELIAAVATPTEVLFVAPVSREVVSLPLEVRDLDWVVP